MLEQQLAQHERQSLKARQLAMAHGLPTDDRDGTAADVAGTMSYIKSVCDLPAFSLRRTRVAANKRSPLKNAVVQSSSPERPEPGPPAARPPPRSRPGRMMTCFPGTRSVIPLAEGILECL